MLDIDTAHHIPKPNTWRDDCERMDADLSRVITVLQSMELLASGANGPADDAAANLEMIGASLNLVLARLEEMRACTSQGAKDVSAWATRAAPCPLCGAPHPA